jgi:D-amino-acid dehydrogenase
MLQMKAYLQQKGVHFFVNEEVLEFHKQGNVVKSLTTKKQSISFDELVISAGSWSPILAKMLGIKLLVQAGKGYRMNVFRKTNINYPNILTDVNTAVTPMDGFTRFGGTMEIAGINETINKVRVQQIAKNAISFYPNLEISKEEISLAKSGLRPVSPDGLPFIGRVQNYTNVCIATGHAMMGWTLGPATGKLISEIISNKKPTLNLAPFMVHRKF